MGIREVNEYLRELRKSKRISQSELGDAAGISLRQISRWETGKGETSAEVMLKIMSFLGASFDHVECLLSPSATAEQAKELAIQRLTKREVPSHPDETIAALETILRLREDPQKLSRLLGFAQGLLSEKQQ